MKVALVLTLNVVYDANGEPAEDLKDRLERMVRHAVGDGLLTGDSPAEVEHWDFSIRQETGA